MIGLCSNVLFSHQRRTAGRRSQKGATSLRLDPIQYIAINGFMISLIVPDLRVGEAGKYQLCLPKSIIPPFLARAHDVLSYSNCRPSFNERSSDTATYVSIRRRLGGIVGGIWSWLDIIKRKTSGYDGPMLC